MRSGCTTTMKLRRNKSIIHRIDTFVSWEETTFASTSTTEPVFAELLLDFKTHLPNIFRNKVLMMLRAALTYHMIPVYHQQLLPFFMVTSTRVTDVICISSRILYQLYHEMMVNRYKEVNYFSTEKLLNVGKFGGNHRMYSHNTLRMASVFFTITNNHNTNTVEDAHCSARIVVYFRTL